LDIGYGEYDIEGKLNLIGFNFMIINKSFSSKICFLKKKIKLDKN